MIFKQVLFDDFELMLLQKLNKTNQRKLNKIQKCHRHAFPNIYLIFDMAVCIAESLSLFSSISRPDVVSGLEKISTRSRASSTCQFCRASSSRFEDGFWFEKAPLGGHSSSLKRSSISSNILKKKMFVFNDLLCS